MAQRGIKYLSAALALFAFSAIAQTTPNLPAIGTPLSTDLYNCNQGGTAYKCTASQVYTAGVNGVLPVANGGNGTATPALIAGTNITLSGSWPNITINGPAGGGMIYPGTGVATSTGSTWGTSLQTGTSGGTIPLLNGINTWSGLQTFNGGATGNGPGLSLPSGYQSINNNSGTIAGRHNPIINGDFEVWQLGTSFSNPANFTELADRWNFSNNGTVGTFTVSQYTVPTSVWGFNSGAPFYPKHAARLTNTAAGSGNTFYDFSTQIEGVKNFANQQVTISYWAVAFSGTPTIADIITEQYFGSTGSPSASVFTTNAGPTLSNNWTRYSTTITLADVSGKTLGTSNDDSLDVIFRLPLNTTFDIGITNVQIEPGNQATQFENVNPAQEMAEAQRYTQTSYGLNQTPGSASNTFGAFAFTSPSTAPVFTIPLKTPMRVQPVATFYNPLTGATGTCNNAGTAVNASVNTYGVTSITVALSGVTSGTVVTCHYLLRDPSF